MGEKGDLINRFICIHSHFYQPPREDPWTEEVMLEESAHPYHDWNERITAECYAPNTASPVFDQDGNLIHIINNYSWTSFDLGPTLLAWMEKKAPSVYKSILRADERSVKKFSGHGSAIAHPYSHVVLPLANARDRRTLVKWGIIDFQRHFHRYPEGMWLPETAVNYDTLEALAEEGIKFTILAPHQAEKVRKMGEEEWTDVSNGTIDPKRPYLCRLPSGKTLSIFFYDKYVSHDVAFGNLLDDGRAFAIRLVGAFTDEPIPQLENIATDGETYGHHRRYGHLALSACLHYIIAKKLARVTNYGEFLEKFPPEYEVRIIEDTSWSCAHGIERWRSGCGCNTGLHPSWRQDWRRPFREANDWLRDRLSECFELYGSKLLKDPWKAREDFISVAHKKSKENFEYFLARHAVDELSHESMVKAIKLLEMQKQSLLMQMSCAWFFDDITSIECIQSMKHAARAIQLCQEATGVDLEGEYIRLLQKAKSNIIEEDDGSMIYLRKVKPYSVGAIKAAASWLVGLKVRAILNNLSRADLNRIEELVKQVEELSITDKDALSVNASYIVKRWFNKLKRDPTNVSVMKELQKMLNLLRALGLNQNPWFSYKVAFFLFKKYYNEMRTKALHGDKSAAEWLSSFKLLADQLGIKFRT